MAIRINHNTASLLIRNNLDNTTESLNRTMVRLSSGERITRAGDDAAGMAISQSLRNQIRSLQQNVRNVNDGVSVMSTAESALANISDMLNRIRELALSSGSAALSDSNRQLNNQETQQLIQEIQRLAQTTDFNGKKLLDGTYANARIQTGAASGQYVTLTLPSTKSGVLGAIARVTGAAAVSTAAIAGGGDLVINGFDAPATAADGVSTDLAGASAIAKANAINQVFGSTGVTAKAEATVLTGVGPIGGINLDGGAASLSINGVNLGVVQVAAGDATTNLVTRINMIKAQTGVVASQAPTGELVLTAQDGRNIQIVSTGGAAATLGLTGGAAAVTQTGRVSLSSIKAINVSGTLGLIGFGASQALTNVDSSWALSNLNVASFDNAQKAVESVDAAIQSVLATRAQVGALQNRLSSTADSLQVLIENLSASDSRIRDADFALETAQMTRDQIIQNASAAILAQANSMPRSVLEFLLK